MHSRESNYSSLSNYFVSAKKRKREWNNGISKFVYLYIYSKNPLWLRIISRVKQRFSKVVKLYLLQSKKKKKSCETRTIRSNEVNRKPFTKTVLLTSKTGICEKLNEPFEPQFNLTDLKTVDSCGSPRFSWFRVFFFFFFWVLTDSAIDEASTSDIEIATLFVLIPLFSLAHILFLHFLRTAISAFSLSLRFFRLLFLQFSASLLLTPYFATCI